MGILVDAVNELGGGIKGRIRLVLLAGVIALTLVINLIANTHEDLKRFRC